LRDYDPRKYFRNLGKMMEVDIGYFSVFCFFTLMTRLGLKITVFCVIFITTYFNLS
jgi:hypothetical protein